MLNRLLSPPFALDNYSSQSYRKFGLIRVLDWLAAQPGRTWQDRWNASGAGIDGHADWRPQVARWLRETGKIAPVRIPIESDHPFRSNPIADSGVSDHLAGVGVS